MNKQSIEILNAIINCNSLHNNYDKNLVIIYPTGILFLPYISFNCLLFQTFFISVNLKEIFGC